MNHSPADDSLHPAHPGSVDHSDQEIQLDQAVPGQYLVRRIGVENAYAPRLKQFGICEGRSIRVVTTGNPMILVVQNSRVGLSRAFASSITAVKHTASVEGTA